MGYAKVNFQFLKHGTDEPLSISGHGTIRDIDAGQGVRIPSDSGLDNVYLLKDNDFLTVDGNYVVSPVTAIEPDDPRGWLNLFYNTDWTNGIKAARMGSRKPVPRRNGQKT